MFKVWSIREKIGAEFFVVLVLAAAVAIESVVGIGGVTTGANQTTAANTVKQKMAQKEIDHLNWASGVSSLLEGKDVAELEAQTDPHKCGFEYRIFTQKRVIPVSEEELISL